MAASRASSIWKNISTSRRSGSRQRKRSDLPYPGVAGSTGTPAFPSGSSLLRPSNVRPQRQKLLADRARRVAFDFAITRHQGHAERRQDRAAAVLAAGLALDGATPAETIDLVHQIPRPLVGHVHRAARGRDRAATLDIFQKLDFARPDASLRVKVDTSTQRWQRPDALFRHGRSALPLRAFRLPSKPFANKTNRLHILIDKHVPGRI